MLFGEVLSFSNDQLKVKEYVCKFWLRFLCLVLLRANTCREFFWIDFQHRPFSMKFDLKYAM